MNFPEDVGHYRITAKLGEGGMGVVHRATDTRLRREVALKILPEKFAADPERMGRFKREATVLASLNHPNIAAVYGVEERALIMELIEGQTLAERIAQGPVPWEEAMPILRQMAEALEYAHEHGVVHRDLKPANVMITAEGRLKLLDFGLAKALGGDPIAEDPLSSTITMRETAAGMIVGTAAYMSPEQAVGKSVDRRTDIWSFGVVLWEMLTGRRLFQGETLTHTLAAVISGPMDLGHLPPGSPAGVEPLLRRCLDRDVKTRLRDIGEARIALEDGCRAIEPAVTAVPPRRRLAWLAAGALAVVAFGAGALVRSDSTAAGRARHRYQIDPPEGGLMNFEVSPDGRSLAFVTVEGVTRRTWVRSMDDLEAKLMVDLPTDTSPRNYFGVFWSRDGEQLIAHVDRKFYRMPGNGGPPVTIAETPQRILGGTMLDGGVILYTTPDGVYRLSPSGGEAVKIDDERATKLGWLPDRSFVYARADGIYAGRLDGGRPVRILRDGQNPSYVPPLLPGPVGRLLFQRGRVLMAQRFRPDDFTLEGDAVPVAKGSGEASGAVIDYSVSETGVMVLLGGSAEEVALTWLDRAGRRLETIGKPFRLPANPSIRLSPDDSKAIVTILSNEGTDLWIADLRSGTFSRLTFDRSNSGVWSPDGRKVLWTALDGSRYLRPADGSGKDELLFKTPLGGFVMDWSADGKLVTIAQPGEKSKSHEIGLVALEGDRIPYAHVQSRFPMYWVQFAPDSRWLAYVSEESSQQVFIESIPAGRARRQVSPDGGDWPIWRRDGKELFYRRGTEIMAAPVRIIGSSVETGQPQALFTVPNDWRFQVSRDGQRFLVALPTQRAAQRLTVDTDWQAGMEK